MVKRLRESADNTFYCAEITYDKSGRNVCVYTADIKEVQRSTKPKDEMKVDGSFMVRRKYFRSREEAESFIDSQDKCMTINKDESIGSKRRSRRMNEDVAKFVGYLDEANSDMYSFCDNLRNALREIRISDLTDLEKDEFRYVFGTLKDKIEFEMNDLMYDMEEKLNRL